MRASILSTGLIIIALLGSIRDLQATQEAECLTHPGFFERLTSNVESILSVFSFDKSVQSCGPREINKILSAPGKEELNRLHQSFYFYDPYHFIYDTALETTTHLKPPEFYDGSGTTSFDKYLAARRKTMTKISTQKLLTTQGILDLHLQLTPVGEDSEITGEFRSNSRGYFTEDGVEPSKLTALNPYLSEHAGENRVEFPPPPFSDIEDWHRLLPQEKWPTFEKLLLESRKKFPRKRALRPNDIEIVPPQMVPSIIQMLVNTEKEKLTKSLAEARGNKEKILDATAVFYRNFVSIHPFEDGNGRIGRLLTEKILSEYNINPPIWLDFGNEIEVPEEEFKKKFRESVAASDTFNAGICKDPLNISEKSLNIAPIFGMKASSPQQEALNVSPSDFFHWVKDTNHSLVSDGDENGVGFKNKVTDLLEMYKASRSPSGAAAPELVTYLPTDSIESRRKKVKNLVENIAPRLESDFVTYSYQPYISDLIENGIDTHYTSRELTDANRAGDGLYVSANPYDSSQYMSDSAALAKVTIKKGVRVINVADKKNAELLQSMGVSLEELYLSNPDAVILYGGGKDRDWGVIKLRDPKKVTISAFTENDATLEELQNLQGKVAKAAQPLFKSLLDKKKLSPSDSNDSNHSKGPNPYDHATFSLRSTGLKSSEGESTIPGVKQIVSNTARDIESFTKRFRKAASELPLFVNFSISEEQKKESEKKLSELLAKKGDRVALKMYDHVFKAAPDLKPTITFAVPDSWKKEIVAKAEEQAKNNSKFDETDALAMLQTKINKELLSLQRGLPGASLPQFNKDQPLLLENEIKINYQGIPIQARLILPPDSINMIKTTAEVQAPAKPPVPKEPQIPTQKIAPVPVQPNHPQTIAPPLIRPQQLIQNFDSPIPSEELKNRDIHLRSQLSAFFPNLSAKWKRKGADPKITGGYNSFVTFESGEKMWIRHFGNQNEALIYFGTQSYYSNGTSLTAIPTGTFIKTAEGFNVDRVIQGLKGTTHTGYFRVNDDSSTTGVTYSQVMTEETLRKIRGAGLEVIPVLHKLPDGTGERSTINFFIRARH